MHSRRMVALSETIVLAGITTIGYAAAFAYEAGVAQAYGIPKELIDVRLSTVFLAIGGLVVIVAMPVMQAVQFVTTTLPQDRRILQYLKPLIVLGLATIVFSAVAGSAFRFWRISLFVAFALLALLLLGAPLVQFKAVHGYREKLKAAAMQSRRRDSQRVLVIGSIRVGAALTDVLLVVAAVVPLAYTYGVGEATNRETYWRLKTNPEGVVLRVYGDKIVVGQIDRKAKKLLPIYSIMPIGDSSSLFVREKLGPLEVPAN